MKLFLFVAINLVALGIIGLLALFLFEGNDSYVAWLIFGILPVTYIFLTYLYGRWSGDE